VTLRDADVGVEGWVPSSVVGNVWIAAAGEKKISLESTWSTASFVAPNDARPKTLFVERAIVRAARDASSPIVAIVLGKEVVGFVNANGPWTDVEIVRPYARIRGSCARREAHRGGIRKPRQRIGQRLRDVAFGIIVTVGACLYDKPHGDVVGVQIRNPSVTAIATSRPGARSISILHGRSWGFRSRYGRIRSSRLGVLCSSLVRAADGATAESDAAKYLSPR
jgi:hypothetical protein